MILRIVMAKLRRWAFGHQRPPHSMASYVSYGFWCQRCGGRVRW